MLSLLPSECWDYGLLDAIRGLETALSPRRASSRSALHLPGLGKAIPTRSARAAIVLALKALALPPSARVGVPLYCCPVVFKAVEAAGCRVRFIDVDPLTYCLSPSDLASKNSEVDAVIAVHMFGNVCDMPRLREAAPGKPFIEDCAQSLGSRLDDRPAGSFGEIAAFSFRSGKYLSVGEGGALYSSDAGLLGRLSELSAGLPVPGRKDECLHVANTFARSCLRNRPLWGVLGAPLWQMYSEKVSYASQSPLVLSRSYESDLTAAIRRLPLLDSLIERQRAHADYYNRNLTVSPDMLCSEGPNTFYNRLQYPIRFRGAGERERVATELREVGISTSRPYSEIAHIATAHYAYGGDCPEAERIARRLAVIPCHHALTASEVARVATCVNRAWEQVARRPPGL